MAKRKSGSLDAWLGRGKSTEEDTGGPSKRPTASGAASTSKHSTSFNDNWLKGRESWLSSAESGMSCKLCQKHNFHGKKGTWTKVPCVRWREEALKEQCRNLTVVRDDQKF